METAGLDEVSVEANGITFSCLAAGTEGSPLALCLHGFPDTAFTWRHLLPALAERGYRAVAPFLRGYGGTGPAPDGNYQIGAVVRDANRLHEVLGGSPDAVLIGHDWGALATYGAVGHDPGRWRRAVTAAVPPAGAINSGFLSYDQLRRSWYMHFFQSPMAEVAVSGEDYAFIERLWADWSPGYDAGEDLRWVKEALGTPERLSAAIGYYRALFDPSRHDPSLAGEQSATSGPVPKPTLYLHAKNDGCFGLEVVDDPIPFLGPGSEMIVIEGCGHFLHLERPAEVNAAIVDFVGPAA